MTIIATSKERFTNQNDAKSEEGPDCYDVLDGVDLDQLTKAEWDVLGLKDKVSHCWDEVLRIIQYLCRWYVIMNRL